MARGAGPGIAAAAGAAVVGATGTLGADLGWAAALGRAILDRGSIPDGIPFAAAATAGWPNVPVAAEVVLGAFWEGFGDRGFLLLQAAAVAAAFGLVAADARAAGARRAQIAAVLVLVAVGGLAGIAVIRLQLFSLALFPALVYLVRSEARNPSQRVWLLVPLVAVWSNLHGAVLLGVAVAAAYLLFERARREPFTAAAVLAALPLAACATPALNRTVTYYSGVLGNEAAARETGLWADLTLESGLDILLIVAALALVALALWTRPRIWEVVCLAGLSAATVGAARNGVWLVLFAAAPAAAALPRALATRSAGNRWPVALVAAAAGVVAFGLVQGPRKAGASDRLSGDAVRLARGEPILAPPAIAEQLVLAGGRVWISNPLDAFREADQKLYLDWVDNVRGGDRLLRNVTVVVVTRGGPQAARVAADTRFRRAVVDSGALVFVRRRE
jgi:hypothetical protein